MTEARFESAAPKPKVRRRMFWSMLGVASVALVIAGVVAALVGQSIVARQVRLDLARQAEAIENLLGERISDDPDSARLLTAVLEGERDLRTVLANNTGQARPLFQLVASARRLFASPLVDLVFVDKDGSVQFLTPANQSALEGRLPPGGIDSTSQFITIPAGDVEGDVPVFVHIRTVQVEGFEDAPVSLAIVVARRSAFIDVAQVLRGMAVALSVAVVLSALFSRLLAGRMTRRLDGMAAAATSLAAGDGTARAPVEGDDEISRVAESFNAMAARLEDLAEYEREFLMSVGHDLRTPLTTIAGYAELLEEGDLDEAETGRIAGVLAAETARLRRLVEDLMLLARLEAREFTLEVEEVDVAEHVREVVEGFRPRADAAHVSIETDIVATGQVRTDADRVAQILGNLLENALRYSPEAAAVSVRVRPVEAEIELSVSDMGPGIDDADLAMVFEKFYVARRYRRVRPEGSGLGLSIVKQLVDALGGRIMVTSPPDEGTTVWVRLPN